MQANQHGPRLANVGAWRPTAADFTSFFQVGAGDEIKVIARDANAVPVSEITRLYVAKRYGDADVASVRRALRVAALPESWKAYFRERLKKAGTPKS